jgi:hypothetical protein
MKQKMRIITLAPGFPPGRTPALLGQGDRHLPDLREQRVRHLAQDLEPGTDFMKLHFGRNLFGQFLPSNFGQYIYI